MMVDLLLFALIVAGAFIAVCEFASLKQHVSRLDAHADKLEKDRYHGR